MTRHGSWTVVVSITLMSLLVSYWPCVAVVTSEADASGESWFADENNNNETVAPVTSKPLPPGFEGIDQVDIFFKTFSESRVQSYLDALYSAAGLESSESARVVPLSGRVGYSALELGTSYVFSLRILPRSLGVAEQRSSAEIAFLIVSAVERERAAGPRSGVFRSTMYRAVQARPEYRLSVPATLGINYVWTGFVIAGVIMAFICTLLFLRKRGTDEAEDSTMIDHETHLPTDETQSRLKHLETLLLINNRKKEREEEAVLETERSGDVGVLPRGDELTIEMTSMPKAAVHNTSCVVRLPTSIVSLQNTLENDNFFALPPLRNETIARSRGNRK